MAVTLTIKQVPERLADGLRRRAAVNRRSQQQELLLMLERTVDGTSPGDHIAEPNHAVYHTGAAKRGKRAPKASDIPRQPTARLCLDALWQRARQLGGGMPAESSAIVRADRDAGHR